MRPLLFICFPVLCMLSSAAQDGTSFSKKSNLVKLNLTSPFLKNYSIQYERIINKRVSVAVSGRLMPASTLPFKNAIRKEVIKEEDELITDAFNQAKFSNYAITPEVRFYLGKKGYGQGFYIAPYYRFAKYTVEELHYTYEDLDQDISIKLTGNLKSHTGGFLVGAQWMLSNTIGLDWWILGPNIGGGRGHITGVSNQPIDPDVQQDIRESLENDLDIPFTKTTVDVNANGANLKLSGPWAGVRAGLLLTFRF
ncbi:DUF3575 domain-containing protein [Niabella sp. 22666]|uniref:DUF3575 domain-containing protein n=1 Tax=Niabella sp. 22666 TaxID=3453954 RepID=UPI003F871D68